MLTAIHRDPFSVAPHVYNLPEGATLADMAKRVRTLPEGWPRHEHDVITINGHIAPPALWGSIRPKPGVEVGFHAPPMGGDGGGKQILSLVASIALIAVSGGITSGALLGGLTGAGAAGQATLLSRLIGGAVLIGGSMALAALSPSPTIPRASDDTSRNELGAASAQGNALGPNEPFPRVVGTRKIFPRYASEPLSYYDGQDEVVEAVVGLAGPHKLEDIRIAGAPIDGMAGVEYETVEGWPGYEPLTLAQRYSRTNPVQTELRGHVVREDAATQLESPTGNLADALPQPKVISTRNGPDEFWIDLNFPQGVFQNSFPDSPLRVPFRLRMRLKGTSSWRNLPEMHYAAASVGEKRATIHMVWHDSSINAAGAATARGWVEGRYKTIAQTLAPGFPAWEADSYFTNGGGGDDYIDGSNSATSNVNNLFLGDSTAEISLNRADWPPGQYEVEIVRGYAFFSSQYASAGYTIKGSVRDPFAYEGGNLIAQSKEGLSDKCLVVRGISVWNDPPVQGGDLALIALRARNVSIEKLSVKASGYVRDWDGSGWNTWTTTSNPAPHMRDVLGGLLNALPVPADIIDDDGLVAWRTACISEGYTVDAICEGLSLADAANLIAGAGYAKPYQSEIWGVVRDYDRSGETPVQVFSPHNMGNFSWSKGFAKRPDGLRITFSDADQDGEARQIIHPPGAGLTEQVSYDGFVSEADCRARADYDLMTAEKRSTFYSFDAPAEAVKCRRGDLIYVQHDMLSEFAGSGRIVDLEYDASDDVAAIWLDNEPPEIGGLAWADIGAGDWDDIDDMGTIEQRAGVILRGGGVSVHACTIAGAKVTLDTPATLDDLGIDDLAVIGPRESEGRRLVVFSMQPREELVWTITAVDEAPEIWA